MSKLSARDRILNEADPEAVFAACGIQTSERTHKDISILCPCPDHNDQKFGNCRYNFQRKRWHCFACNRGGNIIDIVMMKNGWDTSDGAKSYEAMKEIASLCCLSIPELEDDPKKKKEIIELPPKLSETEMVFLGISNSPVKIKNLEVNDENPFYGAEEGDFGEKIIQYNPFTSLRTSDPDAYCFLVISRARNMLQELRKKEANELFYLCTSNHYSERAKEMLESNVQRKIKWATEIENEFLEYEIRKAKQERNKK